MSARVGLVAVSHSRALAEAAVHLALEMAPQAPPLRVAAGMPDGALGADAMAVAEAVGAVGDEVSGEGPGVMILTDLGSAVLSAEMALEFLEAPVETRIVPAPFVEGLLAAVVAAAGGADLDTVAGEASQALRPKQEQLGAGSDAFDARPTGESAADGAASGQASEAFCGTGGDGRRRGSGGSRDPAVPRRGAREPPGSARPAGRPGGGPGFRSVRRAHRLPPRPHAGGGPQPAGAGRARHAGRGHRDPAGRRPGCRGGAGCARRADRLRLRRGGRG